MSFINPNFRRKYYTGLQNLVVHGILVYLALHEHARQTQCHTLWYGPESRMWKLNSCPVLWSLVSNRIHIFDAPPDKTFSIGHENGAGSVENRAQDDTPLTKGQVNSHDLTLQPLMDHPIMSTAQSAPNQYTRIPLHPCYRGWMKGQLVLFAYREVGQSWSLLIRVDDL